MFLWGRRREGKKNFCTKYLEQSKESSKIGQEQEPLSTCVKEIFERYCQSFIAANETGHYAMSVLNLKISHYIRP